MGFLGVGCNWCQASIKLENLGQTDAAELIKMHSRASPRCTFTAQFTKKIAFPKWKSVGDRSRSFNNRDWQQETTRPTAISNRSWAELGAFFSEDYGSPTCFSCGFPYFLTGQGWTKETVVRNHAYEQPRCQHLIKIKGIAFVEEVMARPFNYKKDHSRKIINI